MSAAAELTPGLARRLRAIEPRPRFLTAEDIEARVWALARRIAGVVGAETIGKTRVGRSLNMLTIGSGARHAVVIGMTHPNEPTGGLGALGLAETLAADDALRASLGLTWHIIPCADPDGAALNAAWFAGPYDRATYARHFYRPPFGEQVEWTFHMADREASGLEALPESRALMQVIDAYRPELLVSMHNAEVGGLFCYVTDDAPDVTAAMAVVSQACALPIQSIDPEGDAEECGPGVYNAPPSTSGAAMLSSTDYAARHGAFGVVTEPPMWADVRVGNPRPTASTRAETKARFTLRHEQLAAEYRGWIGRLDRRLVLTTPWHRAVLDDTANLAASGADADPIRNGDAPGSVAYTSTLAGRLHLHRLRAAGHLVGALQAEMAAGNDDAAVAEVLAAVQRRIAEWGAEADDASAPFVGLHEAVQAHVGLALAAAAALGAT